MESLQRKVNFLGKVVLWIGVFAVNSAICLPGIIIALQYRKDTCVTNTTTYNLLLDWWLLLGSMFQYSTIFMMLPCVCFVLQTKMYRIFQIITNLLIGIWIAIGIFLVSKSDLQSCEHDSLWVMSLAFIIVYGVWLVFLLSWVIVKNVDCGALSHHEPDYHQLWTGQVNRVNGDRSVNNGVNTGDNSGDNSGDNTVTEEPSLLV